MDVGLIGLGAMGGGMARSLRAKGHAVHVCDVRAEAAAEFAAEGGIACANPAEVARGAAPCGAAAWAGTPAITAVRDEAVATDRATDRARRRGRVLELGLM